MSDGGIKVPQDDIPPSTTSYFWDGTSNAYFTESKNGTLGIELVIGNNTAVDIGSVSVSMSGFTGSGGSISSVAVSSSNVWDWTGRPIEQFLERCLKIEGISMLTYEQYDQQHLPEKFRLPCTMTAGQCSANGGTVWADRPDHDKCIPEIMVPYEFYGSSFTVYASSSQSIWFDVYIAKTLPAGQYTATITVKENGSTVKTITVNLTVRNSTYPDVPNYKYLLNVGRDDITERMNGVRFPANSNLEPYYTTRKRFLQMAHRHGTTPFGIDNLVGDVPSPTDSARLSGDLYASATGYGMARGESTGDTVYSIGTYGSPWQSAWSTTNATVFCAHASAWATYFKNNHPDVRAFIYLADETLTGVPVWSNWLSTVTACQVSGYKVNGMVTSNWTSVQTGAPYVNMPFSTGWIGVSSPTWQAAANNYLQGLTPGTTTAGSYNGKAPWSGTIATEDDGISPLVIAWGDAKMGIPVHLYWESTYYNNYQGGMGNTHLFSDAATFGGTGSYDAQRGRTGWNYTNGDGVLMYPGTDAVYPAESYGVNAPFASRRLKMTRKSIQDYDLIVMARAVNAAATNAIVASMVPQILWENQCYELTQHTGTDCTYYRGPRSWTNNPDNWEYARNAIANLIPAGTVGINNYLTGDFKLIGGGTFR